MRVGDGWHLGLLLAVAIGPVATGAQLGGEEVHPGGLQRSTASAVAENVAAAESASDQGKAGETLVPIADPQTSENSETTLERVRLPGNASLRAHGVEPERLNFGALILGNPNYFGNQPAAGFEPVKIIKLNTSYEELKCVGFNPELDQLEAVVHIKREWGYGGSVCSQGTPEYVRFYLSFDGGSTWTDQGMATFTAHNIPGSKPLEYAVTLRIKPKKKICKIENLPKVRAILSWKKPPTPNTPDYPPVWGNVLEARIQVAPWMLIPIDELFMQTKTPLPLKLGKLVDLSQTVEVTQPKPVGLVELQRLYQKQDVPKHRLLFKQVQQLIDNPESGESSEKGGAATLPSGLNIDLATVVLPLLQTIGSTKYEELRCLGLDPNLKMLVGTLTVKLPYGYLGPLCSLGSREYVAFWVDWGDGGGWKYVGTTSVKVHDIKGITKRGLQYAVCLPIDLHAHQHPCSQGPKTAKVRAVLSWQVPPPPNNPDKPPRWGNRKETLIHIPPGPTIPVGDYTPYLEGASGVYVCAVDQSAGLTTVNDKPFGAVIWISGHIPGAPDKATPVKYRMSVRKSPFGPWQRLSNSFSVWVTEQTGSGLPMGHGMTQHVDPDGFYKYLEDANPSGSGWRLVHGRRLARWITAAPMTGKWEIMVEAKDPGTGILYPAGTILCSADGTSRKNLIVRLDEIRPTAQVKITGYSRGGGPVKPATDCGTFRVGDVIHGTYTASDKHFRRLTLRVEPTAPAGALQPPVRPYPVVPTTGETGNWTLNTKEMKACGYVVRLHVWDRTIVSGDADGWDAVNSVGFCLTEPPE